MKKFEKLKKEAELLRKYAEELKANLGLLGNSETLTAMATNELLSSPGDTLNIERYRAKIHQANMVITRLHRDNEYANATLKAGLKAIEAEYYETNQQ